VSAACEEAVSGQAKTLDHVQKEEEGQTPPKVYLDMCALKRPYDDASQPRIVNEGRAVARILAAVAQGQILALRSPVHDAENSRNRDVVRRATVDAIILQLHAADIDPAGVSKRAEELHRRGFAAADAAHLASAEAGGADVFITVDDRLLRTAHRQPRLLKVSVLSALDFQRRYLP